MWPSIHLPGTDVSTSSYNLFHVVGWFSFYFVGSHLTRSRVDLQRHWIWLAIGFALCDTLGAGLLFRLIRGTKESGFYGGPLLFASATLAYVIARRIGAYPFLDAWAVAFSVAHVFEKLACLAAGCCFGGPTDFRLGVALRSAEGDPTRFQPLPACEAVLHLLTASALGWLYAKGRFRGRLVMVLGVIYGTWRAMIELARGGRRSAFLEGPLSITQVVCIVVIAFSGTYLVLGRSDVKSRKPVGP